MIYLNRLSAQGVSNQNATVVYFRRVFRSATEWGESGRISRDRFTLKQAGRKGSMQMALLNCATARMNDLPWPSKSNPFHPRSLTSRGVRSKLSEIPMVGVAQLVRAHGCGPWGRGFESLHPPHFLLDSLIPDSFFASGSLFLIPEPSNSIENTVSWRLGDRMTGAGRDENSIGASKRLGLV